MLNAASTRSYANRHKTKQNKTKQATKTTHHKKRTNKEFNLKITTHETAKVTNKKIIFDHDFQSSTTSKCQQ
jgi:hypothetical protein